MTGAIYVPPHSRGEGAWRVLGEWQLRRTRETDLMSTYRSGSDKSVTTGVRTWLQVMDDARKGHVMWWDSQTLHSQGESGVQMKRLRPENSVAHRAPCKDRSLPLPPGTFYIRTLGPKLFLMLGSKSRHLRLWGWNWSEELRFWDRLPTWAFEQGPSPPFEPPVLGCKVRLSLHCLWRLSRFSAVSLTHTCTLNPGHIR
jgi:hypothetical protein